MSTVAPVTRSARQRRADQVRRFLRRLRPGLRVQIALAVWGAVMLASTGMRATAVAANSQALDRFDQETASAAIAVIRADWSADTHASAAAYGARHRRNASNFAVWQARPVVAPGEAGEPYYRLDQVSGKPAYVAVPDEYVYPQMWVHVPSSKAPSCTYDVNADAQRTVQAFCSRGDGSGLVVVQVVPQADWTANQVMAQTMRDQASVVAIISALGAWLLSGLLMRPAQRAAAVARRLGQGDLDARVRVGGRDEIGQLGTALNEMAADVQRMVSAQRHFISDTAHELRTPTAALLASAAALENPGTRDEAAAMVAPQLRRLSGLTEDLLSLSRFDDRREERDDQVVDLVELSQRAAAQVAGDADVRVDADGPVFAIVDPARVATIVRNLVANGLRHGEAPVRLVVSESGQDAVVRVHDAGRGVPEHLREAIFDRFVRADQARHGEGAGLGLAIARENAELHGGSLAVNPDGHGFQLVLPMRPDVRRSSQVARVVAREPLGRRLVDDVVAGLFSNGLVFLLATPFLFRLDVLDDYGRIGLAVGLVVAEVLGVTAARRLLAPLAPHEVRWALGPAALGTTMAVAVGGYRIAVAASMAVGWALWMLLELLGRRR